MKLVVVIATTMVFALSASAESWKVDLSRRVKETKGKEAGDAPEKSDPMSFIQGLFESSSEPVQEFVILNTDHGFVPATVRVRQGGNYRLHLVNVNEKEKNVSFVLDAFSEHHATYFGKIKTFDIHPQKDGVFRFVSPETAAQGRLVVYPAAESVPAVTPNPTTVRQPSSEE